MRKTSINLLIFALLAAFLASPAILLDNSQEYGPELLSNPSFNDNGEGWILQGKPLSGITFTDGVLQIVSSDKTSSLSIYQKLLPNSDFPNLRLQGDLAVENVVSGEKGWHKARLVLMQYVDGKIRYRTSHVVTALDGTSTWQHYKKNFAIAPEAEFLRVIVQLSKATGLIQAKNISLRPVQKSPWYKNLEIPARICFYIFLLFLVIPYLRDKKSHWLNCSICIVVVAICIAISLPTKTKKTLQHSVENRVKQVAVTLQAQKQKIPQTTLPIKIDSTKVGHFSFFVLLGLLLRIAQPKRKSLWIATDIILFAMTTECIQLYIDGREALWSDVLIDCSGGFSGVALGGLWVWVGRLRAEG